MSTFPPFWRIFRFDFCTYLPRGGVPRAIFLTRFEVIKLVGDGHVGWQIAVNMTSGDDPCARSGLLKSSTSSGNTNPNPRPIKPQYHFCKAVLFCRHLGWMLKRSSSNVYLALEFMSVFGIK